MALASGEEHLYYVNVRNAMQVRKDLLTGSKDLIRLLRRHEDFKRIRERKLEKMRELKQLIDDLSMLKSELMSKLPDIKSAKKSKEAASLPKSSVSGMPSSAGSNGNTTIGADVVQQASGGMDSQAKKPAGKSAKKTGKKPKAGKQAKAKSAAAGKKVKKAKKAGKSGRSVGKEKSKQIVELQHTLEKLEKKLSSLKR